MRRVALDEGKQRAVVFDPPRANDVEPREPPAGRAPHVVRDAEEAEPEKPAKR